MVAPATEHRGKLRETVVRRPPSLNGSIKLETGAGKKRTISAQANCLIVCYGVAIDCTISRTATYPGEKDKYHQDYKEKKRCRREGKGLARFRAPALFKKTLL